MPASPTQASAIGIAKETTKGTAVVPSDTIVVTGFNPKRKPTILTDEGWDGSAGDVRGIQQGKIVAEHSIEGAVFVDTIGWWLKNILGDETISGAGPYTHPFAALNSTDQQPPALTATDKLANIGYRGWPGIQLSELKLMVDPDGKLSYTATGLGFPDASAASFTPAPSAEVEVPGWRVSCNVNGAACNPSKLEVTMSRRVNAIKTANNSQNPFAIWVGPLSVTIKGNVIAEDVTHYTNLVNDTQGVFSFTAAQGTKSITVTCTKTAYVGTEVDRGNDWPEFVLDLRAIKNSTDVGASAGLSPIKVVLVNSKSAVY